MNQVVVGLAVVLFANVILNNRERHISLSKTVSYQCWESCPVHGEAIGKLATVT